MSGAGTAAKPRLRWCWVCSRKLHANFHRVAIVDGRETIVHADCAERDGLEVKPLAHLAPGVEKARARSKARRKAEAR